jgi:hypothetical protein
MKITAIVALVSLVQVAVGQGGFSAQWTALQPIVAQWTNAPIGTPGATVSWPPGPLPNAPVVVAVDVPGRTDAARFSSSPQALGPGMASHWLFTATSVEPNGFYVQTTADLLLQITGPAAATGSIEFVVTSYGDSPLASVFRVDFGNDGTFELDAGANTPSSSSMVDRHGAFSWDFARGPLVARVLHHDSGWASAQWFNLETVFRPWVPEASSFGDDCGNEGTKYGFGEYYTNYHLAALPPIRPSDLAALRATGIGGFSGFLISTQSNTVPFHLPGSLSAPCDLLASVALAESGTVSRVWQFGSLGLPVEWVAVVPLLPPGFEFWVQHASMQLPYLGVTNRVRIRT